MAKITVEQMNDYQATLTRIRTRLHDLEESFYKSDIESVLENQYFKELIELGPKIIPYVIKYACREGWNKPILVLLRELAKGDPGRFLHENWHFKPIALTDPSSEGYYRDIMAALNWYVNSVYYTDDPYYGLVDYDKDKS